MTNTMSTNVTNTVPINCNNKKVRHKMDGYILPNFLLVIILLIIITIICYHYAKQVKIKTYWRTSNINMESNE